MGAYATVVLPQSLRNSVDRSLMEGLRTTQGTLVVADSTAWKPAGSSWGCFLVR